MNKRFFLRFTPAALLLFAAGTIALAQDDQAQNEPPQAAIKSDAPPPTGATVDEDGNIHMTVSGTPISQSSIDANGNGTMSVYNNGVKTDYTVTPNGVTPVGSKPAPPDLQANANAQIFEGARRLAADSLKKALGCADAEWEILWPMIQKIQLLQAAVEPGALAMSTSVATDVPAAVTDAVANARELRKLLNDKNTVNTQITEALASLREARARVKTELVQARKALTALVTLRQEAILYNKEILAE
jgi:hypothetical protein